MATRDFKNRIFTLNHDMVILEGSCTIGEDTPGNGAVKHVKGSGIKNVVHNGTGNYTITLDDKYQRYLGGNVGFVSTSTNGSGIAYVEVADFSVQTHVADGTGITFQCFNYSGAKADPLTTSVMGFMIYLRNSSIKGKGE